MTGFDPREDRQAAELLRALPEMAYQPLVDAADLEEIVKVFRGIPELEFPIGSAAELIEKLGGSSQRFEIAQVEVDPLRMIKYMPAYYFPIFSLENFVEKMAELVRQNRRTVDVPRELASIKRQLPRLPYPIESSEHLMKLVGSLQRYSFQGREVDVEEMVARIPADYFPIESEDDFDFKMARLMLRRPLIVRD